MVISIFYKEVMFDQRIRFQLFYLNHYFISIIFISHIFKLDSNDILQ